MLLIIKDKELMILSKQNPKGGPSMKTYTLAIDPDTDTLGFRLGYCDCGCKRPLFIRNTELRDFLELFGGAVDNSLFPKQKVLLRHRIIKFLGGRVED